MSKKEKSSILTIGQLIIVLLIVSLLVGGLAVFLMNKFFLQEIQKQVLQVDEGEEVAPRIMAPEPKLPEEVSVEDLNREPLSSTLVSIYKKKSVLTQRSSSLLKQFYLPEELMAGGFILTSDGWLVTDAEVLLQQDLDELVVEIEQSVYNIEEKVIDEASGVAFLKINTSNMPVSKLGKSSELDQGDIVFTSGINEKLLLNFVEDPQYYNISKSGDLIFSSENLNNLILLQNKDNSVEGGYPVFNKKGEVIGIQKIIDDNKLVALPIDNFQRMISGVLKSGSVKRPFFGVHYLDLAEAVGFSKQDGDFALKDLLFRNLRGAYIYNEPLNKSVVAGGPADEAGLQTGDLVIKVDDVEISSTHRLNEIIQEYKPGDILRVVVVREGKEMLLNIILKELVAGE